jgi:hypothetical protein
MRPSRGMGDIAPSKMPKARNVIKRDGKEPVKVFKQGGKVKKFDEGGVSNGETLGGGVSGRASNKYASNYAADTAWDKLRNLRADVDEAQITDRSKIPAAMRKHDASAPALRKTINTAGKRGYEPEGLPRTYKEGGQAKSKVNAAGNYTKPGLRKRIFNSVKSAAIVGTGAGQWSARKAQVMAKRYKAAGGGYKD